MRYIAAIILTPALSGSTALTAGAVEGFALTLEPFRVPETVDLAARGRMLTSALKDPGSEGNIYLLADKVERFDKSLSETSTAIENVGVLVPYLSGTDYGPKQVNKSLLSFMDELKGEMERLAGLRAQAEAALAAAQPGSQLTFAAQALKQRALNLRTRLEGLSENARILAANVAANQAVLGTPAVLAAQEISERQSAALASSGDGLLRAADRLLRKAH